MEKIPREMQGNDFEQKENYGHDVTIIIDLIRHAEKEGSNGPLTEEGLNDAKEFGQKLKNDFPDSSGTKVYHSWIPRAEQTAQAISEDSLFVSRKREYSLSGKFSKDFLAEFEARANEAKDEDTAVQWYIDSGDEKPNSETASSKETSGMLAEEINHFIDVSARLKEHSKVNIVLVSHSGVIEHFLVDALSMQRQGFLEKIGGGVEYLEGARLIVHRNDKDTVTIKIQFRDNEIVLTPERLKEIASQIQR